MSLKPPKKSDLNKHWIKPRPDKAIRIQPEYHLIVTEGTKTEPQYFNAVKEIINRKYGDKIQLIVSGTGYNTISLFEEAKKEASQNLNGYAHVWVIYDTDDFPAEHINRTAELCRQNSNSDIQYHAIWSNQCIELWYLLHFSFFHSDIHRSEYWPKLSEWMESIDAGKYTKDRPDMFEILKPYMEFGIANARRLDQMNAGKTPANAAPGTKVYELISLLKPYLLE
jgi:hypothetical protein